MEINDIYTKEACDKGAELEVLHPITGESTGCFITVAGIDSKSFRESERKAKRALISDKDADTDQITAQVLADATISWRGFTDNGKVLKFSKKNAENLYLNSPKVAKQVDIFIANRANFTKG